MKKCVYTVIMGEYDDLKEPRSECVGWDFICFSDVLIESKRWKVVLVDKEGKTEIQTQRKLKILPNEIIREYDYSIYCDGSVGITDEMDKLCSSLDYPVFATTTHPCRRCLYEEVRACIRSNHCSTEDLEAQGNEYRKQGMPENFGLIESRVLLRQHNHIDCVEIDKLWWDQLVKYTHRDQISFPFVLWKLNKKIVEFNHHLRSQYFRIQSHKKKRPKK